MRTYAEYLNTMTVKTLHAVAQRMALRGHSKLRKAELITRIDNAIEVPQVDTRTATAESIRGWHIIALDMNAANYPESKVAEVPSKVTVTTEETDTDDLIYAYRAMRKTVRGMGNVPSRVSISNRLRKLSVDLRSRGVDMRTV